MQIRSDQLAERAEAEQADRGKGMFEGISTPLSCDADACFLSNRRKRSGCARQCDRRYVDGG